MKRSGGYPSAAGYYAFFWGYMNYFRAGETVTVVNNANGFDGDWVVFGKVENRDYTDPVTGVGVRLDFDPKKEPSYWLEGAMELMSDGQGDSLCVFPERQLRKKYEKGMEFSELINLLKGGKA